MALAMPRPLAELRELTTDVDEEGRALPRHLQSALQDVRPLATRAASSDLTPAIGRLRNSR